GEGARSIALPVTAALPVLARAQRTGGDLHPTVVLLAGAAHLGLKIVADGRFGPHAEQPWWQPVLTEADEAQMAQLAAARTADGLDAASSEGVVRRMVDAVVDASPRRAPSRVARVTRPGGDEAAPAEFARDLHSRLKRVRRAHGSDDRPQTVTLSLRVE